MRYREFTPGPRASRLVECFWKLEGAAPGMVQRVVPDGRAEIILNLAEPFEALAAEAGSCYKEEDRSVEERVVSTPEPRETRRQARMPAPHDFRTQPQCFLAGQITGPLLLRARGPSQIIGIRFRPGGVGQLLGIPVEDFTGQTVDVRDLGLGALRDASTIREAEHLLMERERGTSDDRVEHAIRLLSADADVGRVAALLNVSTRQLERRFQTRVGMAPKQFARIARFQRVFHAVEAGGSGWVRAAAECGYYDQAHLIRDFRELAGEAPTHLLAGDELARHFLSHFSKTPRAARP